MKPLLKPGIRRQDSHAVQLPDGASPDGWYHLIPAGTFEGRDGRGPYTLDAQAVLAAFKSWGADLCVDFDHQSLSADKKQGAVPASGWIKELQAREDGIWGRIDWTDTAAAALEKKEYRYLSPFFNFDPATGRIVRLLNAGLTNNPNLHLQAAASRQGDNMDEILERLRYLLNLPLSSTAADIAAELDKLKAMIAGGAETEAAAASMRTALGLAATIPLKELATALHARLAQGPDPALFVPKAQYDEAANSLATLQSAQKQAAVDQAVAEAKTAGKVSPAMEGWARDYASRDLDGFKAFAATAPTLASAGAAVTGAPGPGTSPLTDDEKAVAHSLGLTDDAFLAAKKETAR